ncbi:MAG: glycosyltransferase [Planctomycetia bacterium]|jgi:glycosyltransferase involved in cell wall biosynthesis
MKTQKSNSTTRPWKTVMPHFENEGPPRFRIATDVPGTPGQFWSSCTELHVEPKAPVWLKKCLGNKITRLLSNFLFALRLLQKRRSVDGFITGSSIGCLLFACCQTILPWGKKPHVILDCLWCRFPGKTKKIVFSWLLRLAGRSVKKYIVWESHEIEDYAREFGVAADKFQYVHFWHTLNGYDFEINDNGYVFAGGNWNRNYPMLLEIARQMPEIIFLIGTTRPEQLDGYDIPSNVTIRGFTHEGFRQAIADCSIMIVPMIDGLLHTGGQQTVLNAMYLGKPVIAVGHPWASDIIHHGKNGLIVDFGDTQQLYKALEKLWCNDEYRHRISLNGMIEAKTWPPSRSLEQIYRLTLELDESEPIFLKA